MATEETVAEASTRLLRKSDDPLYSRLRVLLAELGVDIERSVLADFFPDDGNLEFGIIVTPAREVFEFDLRHGRGDLKAQVANAWISDWRNRTDRWRDTPHRRQIAEAMGILDAEARDGAAP